MMKLRRKIYAMIITICLLVPLFCMPAMAASGSISMSGGSANVGGTVTVSCKVSCSSGPIGAATVVATYDSSALQYVSATGGANGGSGSVIYAGDGDGSASSLSFSMTFKVLKEGSHKVSASCDDAVDWDAQAMSVSGASATVKGVVPEPQQPANPGNNNDSGNSNNNNNNNNNNTQDPSDTRDSNNSLASLKVSPGTLSPTFSAGKTSYTVTVPAGTTAVTISAKAAGENARVSVTGGKDLKPGENNARVVVTAENGSSKAYNILIVCGEVEKITIGDTQYVINEGFSDDSIPAGFTRGKSVYKDREYTGLVNSAGNLNLLCLQSSAGSTFFIYEKATQSFYPFTKITLDEGKYIIPIPLDPEDENFGTFDEVNLSINDKSIFVWQLDEEFCMVPIINQDGVKLYYKYDSVDGTYQRHAAIPEAPEKEQEIVIEGIVEEDDSSMLDKILAEYGTYILYGTTGAALLFLILMIIFGVKLAKANGRIDDLLDAEDLRKEEGEKANKIQFSKDDDDYDYYDLDE